MNFIKSNKTFIILLLLFFINFASLQFVSCNSSNEIDSVIDSINREFQSVNKLKEEILLYDGLEEEMNTAREDLIKLSRIERSQNRLWESLLNREENLFLDFKDKSSESINADLTKLYSKMRNICESNNILLENNNKNTFNTFGSDDIVPAKKFGFGLQSYDGFWPSFSKDEAKLLGVQSKIISTIVDFLSSSSDDKYSITLNKISREPVGKVDMQHIENDNINLKSDNKLMRNSIPIKSFAFGISFKSHTSHARSFINQLRPPFLIRDLRVNRTVNQEFSGQTTGRTSPFGDESEDNSQQPLPIVSNVDSTFYLLIEYIYMIDRDFESFITENYEDINTDVDLEILKTLLELSGHSNLESKLEKILKNRENN